MGDPAKYRTEAEISPHFHESMRRLFARAVSPRFWLSVSAGPAPGCLMTRMRRAEFQRNIHRYQTDTRHLLDARGLLNMHRRRRTHEFLMRAVFYIMRFAHTANVRLALQFGVRELPPRWMRVKGQVRLVTRREVYESLTVVVNGVRRRYFERTNFDENGHILHWTQVGFQGGGQDAALFQRWRQNIERNVRRTEAESTNCGDQDAIHQVPDQDEETKSIRQDKAASHGENGAAQHGEFEAAPHGENEAAQHGDDEAAQLG